MMSSRAGGDVGGRFAGAIREPVDTDLEPIVAIAREAWKPIFGSFRSLLGEAIFDELYSRWEEEKERQIRASWTEGSGVEFLVAEEDGEVCGFVTWVVRDGGTQAEIGNNAVSPRHQNRGIASALYEALLSRLRAQSVTVVRVTTGLDDGHAPARRAYEKAGFVRNLPSVTYFQDLRDG